MAAPTSSRAPTDRRTRGAPSRYRAFVDEPTIPEHVSPVRRTKDFTSTSVPAGLRRAHHTSVWAEVVVTEGSVVFVDEDSGRSTTVTSGSRHVIAPNSPHHVEPDVDAVFHVQFYAD